MRNFSITALVAAMAIAFTFIFGEFTWVSQGEKVFAYDVTSGKEVNPTDNPLLPMGFNTAWGINKTFFNVNGQVTDYAFTAQRSKKGYDESLEWNSKEGLVMAVEYKLYGQVTDPWTFFRHFVDPEYDYDVEGHTDRKVYEALRQSGKMLDLYLNEVASSSDAEVLRTNPEKLKADLLVRVKEYMKTFGFEVTDLMFSSNFTYPDGNVVAEARQQLTELDSEIRAKTQEKLNKANAAKILKQQASIEANNAIAEANRQAGMLDAESNALATALGLSIGDVGVEGTLRLKSAEIFENISRSGAMPIAILTEKSIFSMPFYPAEGSPPQKQTAAAQTEVK